MARGKKDRQKFNDKKLASSVQTPAETLEALFTMFTSGKVDMDGKTLAKFAKDCKVCNDPQ